VRGGGPEHALEIVDDAPTDEALAGRIDAVRRGLSAETRPWSALLLRHDALDHTLVFAAHRVVCDERTVQELGEQLSQLYGTGPRTLLPADDRGPAAPDTPAEDGARFFARTLASVPPVHGFPRAAPRGKTAHAAAASVEIVLDADASVGLARTARAWHADPFVLEIAAAAYVLAQFCGQDSVAIGIPFDLRPASTPWQLGSHTAMLPVAFETTARSFRDLAAHVGERIGEARAYATTPFHAVAKAVGAGTSLFANPLFQVACAPASDLALTLEGCDCSPRSVSAPPQQVDLFLEMTSGRCRLAFDSGVVDADVAAAFCRSWATVLGAALKDPDRALSEIPLLDEAERAALLSIARGAASPSFPARDLFELLTARFEQHEHKTALVCRGIAMTYGELEQQVEALACSLGSAPGSLVGLCLPRSPEMVAALLAVLRSGAAYVPLDPTFPRSRLAYMVEHSRLSRVITTRALRPLFEGASIEVIEVDGVVPRSSVLLERPAVVAGDGDSVAYVIYTSGSTGKPKGVAVSRRAVANFLASMLVVPGIGQDDTLCAVTTLSFDIAVLELLGPLAAGGTVVIATEEEARDPRLLVALLQTTRATILQATPVTWQMLCNSGWTGDQTLTALSGGEALTGSLAAALVPRVRALWNMYGPTETTVWSTCQRVGDTRSPISVGTPIHNTSVHVLDAHMRPLPPGVEGRLFIGGEGLALGYLHDEELTARRFLPDPFCKEGRIYDTGDRGHRDASGLLHVSGRSDLQTKLRGHRIEPGEIEARLSSHSAIAQAICVVRCDKPESPELVAYCTTKEGAVEPTEAELRAHCVATLPAYMVPSRYVNMRAFPCTPNGKIDRGALPAPGALPPAREPAACGSRRGSDIERAVADVWSRVLSLPEPPVHQTFFEVGGTSLDAVAVAELLGEKLGVAVPVLSIFEHPTIAALATHLYSRKADLSFVRQAQDRAAVRRRLAPSKTAFDVAIVGMAGRFPGARDLDELWTNLCEGRETVTFFGRDELDPQVPASDRQDPRYVPARGVLEAADWFDAAFFGISPSEAELMDPQLRVFLEVAWEAFENAGIVGEDVPGLVGVWAGMGNNFYYPLNVLTRPDKLAIMGEIAAEIGNEKDHIAPRVSHKLNLTGPSLSVHTACSTTLVVIENAYQALVSQQVDVALAGGVDVRTPQKSGQRYEEGGIFTIDGHCRPFDAAATGTMFGEGAGAVVLKRLDDALRDGDTVYAVIKGAAVNHDGSRKVSYLAPSVDGQARVIAAALAIADVNPDTITMVEAHGTATPVGDPIEVEALTRVFRAYTQRRRYCALGSIKGNFGHATTAAGIAGLIKATLALRHRTIPPTLHFTKPNARIDFESSPFFVADKLRAWEPSGTVRRAAVSSFGFCGTNAHAILEEAPPTEAASAPTRPLQLVLASARSPEALAATAEALGRSLRGASSAQLADAAYTTHVGRKRHELRRCAVVGPGEDALIALTSEAGHSVASLRSDATAPAVAFVLPGQGAQHVNMGLALYRNEPRFRDAIDACAEKLEPHLGRDLRALLFPSEADADNARALLSETIYTQPAIFSVSYATATLFMHWGVHPTSVIGHSIGEFVAATLAGVMDLHDALRLVATRGKLMQGLASGSMLAVRLGAQRLLDRLPAGIDLAADNAPEACVLAGPTGAVDRLAEELAAEGVLCRKLATSHAFHSSMMDPVVEPFRRAVESVGLSPPRLAFVSTVTGDHVEAADVTSSDYWARHIRSPVLFSPALKQLLGDGQRVLLDCGPGRSSSTLALQHRPKGPARSKRADPHENEGPARSKRADPNENEGPARSKRADPNENEGPGRVVAAMSDRSAPGDDQRSALLGLGSLWLHGCCIDWTAFHEGEKRRRIAIPTYRFQRQRYWIEPGDRREPAIESSRASQDEPPATAPCLSSASCAPARTARATTEDETTGVLRQLIEELLGEAVDDFDENKSFVAMGLDSILLTQLARAIRMRTGVEVTFRQLLQQYQTLRLLGDAVRSQRSRDAVPAAKPAPEEPTALRLELSSTPAQLEMWVAGLAGPEASCAYNLTLAVTLTGSIDDASLLRALRALPERHQALRGHFTADGSRFVIEPAIDLAIARHDLTGAPSHERSQHLQRLEEEDAKTPYDVERGPLCRAAVVVVDESTRTVLLSVHHAACDGWSLDVLLADLATLCAELAGGGPRAPRPRHSFSDFVAYRASAAGAKQLAASRAHWRETFSSLPPPLELPYNGHRPPVRTFKAHALSHAISPELVEAVRTFAATHELTFFSVLLSGLAALLYRITASTDLVIGIPVAQHPMLGMEDCVGQLVNLVPVRCRTDGAAAFLELCAATHAAVLEAREHGMATFGEIVADLGVPRDPARVPLVSVLFTHVQKYPSGKLPFAGCSVAYRLCPRSSEAFELNLNGIESAEGLELRVHGNADLFSRSWLDRRVRELERLLGEGCRAPGTAVDALPLLPADEAEALRRFNETASAFPRDATLSQLVEQQVDRTTDSPAVRCGSESLSYRELEARANRLARLLRRRGVARGKLVGLCLPRSANMLIALLAVLKAGGAYVPLDPALPAARLAFMIDDAALMLVVSESSLRERHARSPEVTLDIDRAAAELEIESDARLSRDDASARPEDAAYVLYTSGSTGRPKGVCVPHRAAVNFLVSMEREPGLAGGDSLLAVTTLSFDIALLELLLPLTVGARVTIASPEEARDADALQRLMATECVTTMQGTPATWRLLVDGGWRGSPGLKALCGGEALAPDLAATLLDRVDQLWNMYGPTETTVWSTCERVSDTRGGITIGHPIANTRIWVLDAHDCLCPIGVPGEICIGGEGVALGYLGRPELTAERFVPVPPGLWPAGDGGGQKMYRTGDVGRWRADGRVECLGRKDFQVKVRGFRIELGEIEACLADHPAVREACAVVIEPRPHDAALVAYFVPKSGQSVTQTDLRYHLRGVLPDYMVPQQLVALEALPRTHNGKVDRKALPVPFEAPATNLEASPPRTAAERLVAEVWQELIGRSVGAHSNFFESGGDSVRAVQAIAQIEARTGIRLSPRIFVVDTLAQIAAQLEGGAPKKAPAESGAPPSHPKSLFDRIKTRLHM
jgi:amino acid adenylation domain-containing protein